MTMNFYNKDTIFQSVWTPHSIEHVHSTHVFLHIISLPIPDIQLTTLTKSKVPKTSPIQATTLPSSTCGPAPSQKGGCSRSIM